jgi:hypothetical protein
MLNLYISGYYVAGNNEESKSLTVIFDADEAIKQAWIDYALVFLAHDPGIGSAKEFRIGRPFVIAGFDFQPDHFSSLGIRGQNINAFGVAQS